MDLKFAFAVALDEAFEFSDDMGPSFFFPPIFSFSDRGVRLRACLTSLWTERLLSTSLFLPFLFYVYFLRDFFFLCYMFWRMGGVNFFFFFNCAFKSVCLLT